MVSKNRINHYKAIQAARKKPEPAPKGKRPAPPPSENNYATTTYDFNRPLEKPKDWKPTDEKKKWCKYHGPCNHTSEECIQAKDDAAIAKGQVAPSIEINKKRREKKLEERKLTNKAQAAANKEAYHNLMHNMKKLKDLTN